MAEGLTKDDQDHFDEANTVIQHYLTDKMKLNFLAQDNEFTNVDL